MNKGIDSLNSQETFKRYINCQMSWKRSSLMKHYLSPMDFVLLGSPNLFTNNEEGMHK